MKLTSSDLIEAMTSEWGGSRDKRGRPDIGFESIDRRVHVGHVARPRNQIAIPVRAQVCHWNASDRNDGLQVDAMGGGHDRPGSDRKARERTARVRRKNNQIAPNDRQRFGVLA